MKRRIGVLLSGLLLALGFAVIPGSPASAALDDCPGGVGCSWTTANYGSGLEIYPVGWYGYDNCWRYEDSHSRTIRSAAAFYGPGVVRLAFYSSTTCSGSELSIPTGLKYPNILFTYRSWRIESS